MWKFDEFGNMYWEPSTRFSRAMFRVNKVEGDGGEGGGGAGAEETSEQKLAKAIDAATAPLKAQNATLLDEKKKLAATEKLLNDLGGAEKVLALRDFQTKIAKDDILRLASEGKHEEAIAKATEHLTVTYNAEKNELLEKNKVNETELATTKTQLHSLIVDSQIQTAFTEIQGLPTAIPDVLYRAKGVWSVENGQSVPRNQDGTLMQGAKGVMTPKEWIEGLRKSAPHLFPQSNTANIDGGNASSDDLTKALLDAANKSPAALRAEQARQKELKKKASAAK